MKLTAFTAAFLLFCGSIALAQSITSEKDKLVYSLGILMADEFKKSGIDNVDNSLVLKALSEYSAGTNTIDLTTARTIVKKYKETTASKAGVDFLAANAKNPGVVSLPSGLQYQIIKSGPAGGPKPKLTDQVNTHYHGTLIDGKVFDSSVDRGEPISFPLNGVIKGWQEALQLMSVGDKWRLFLPYQLAYGERGAGGSIGPYSALIFEVELFGINGSEKVEKDVAPPPPPASK
jgi:FKBP-type peptidyl-prolyl cis-trans isomerase FklB